MLEFPLHESFFPQVVLNAEEVRYYKRLGKERLNELIRIAEDAELAYKWTDIRTPKMNTTVQKTQFLDMRPATKATFASTLIKCSVVIPDTRPDEVLLAIARGKTKEYRKMMGHLHGSAFLDGRTLFKFPSSIAASRPEYSYRAIKWCALKGKSESNKLDFSFLEYAGKRKPTPGSMVVGFCLQESIQREREIPLLENFGFVRGYLSRSGIIVSKTHQPNVVRVTAICQIDGDIEPLVRTVLEGIMQDMVGSVVRMRGLLDRQRVSGMKFLEQWEWVANGDRKACAVCLKGFFFHRKHHCRACGEVVCSSCAPLRALDEPVYDIRELRICTSCMTKSGRLLAPESSNDRNNQNETLTSDNSSQSYNAGDSRGPKNSSLEERQFLENEIKDRMRRPSDAARLLLDNNNKGTPKSKRRLSTFLKNPRSTVDTISNLVDQIREARDTINITISEAGESRLSFGEEDAYTDLYEEVSKLRDTVEFSVDGPGPNPARPRRPSQLAVGSGGRYMPAPAPAPAPSKSMMRPTLEDAIWGADGHSGDEIHHTSLEYRLSDESVRDNYHSVLEKTFAAARANLAVGRAVLSSCASDHDARFDPHDDDDELPSPSENSGYSSSDTNKDPYASANYDRVMTNLSGTNRDSLGAMYDDGFSNPSAAFAPQRQQQQMHPLRSSRVHVLEKKIEDLQRDLMNAQRKLSYFEPDPEYEGLGIVHEEAFDGEDSPFFRSDPRPMRRPSDFSRRGSAQAPPHTFPRARQAPMKQRPQSDGLLKADFPSRRSIDVGTLERQRGDFRQRRGSEFQARPSTAAATSRASLGGRAHSTAEMLTELFSVMNPGEMSKSAGPHRKGSMMRGLPSSQRARSASPSDTHRASSSQRSSLSRAPPPPPPSAVSMYIDDKGRILPGTPSSSLGSPKAGHGLDKTASSSASYASAFNESHSSTGSGRLRSSGGPRAQSPGYRDVLGPNPAYDDHDEISSSDSSDIFGGVVSNQQDDSHDERDDDDEHEHSAAHDDAPVQPVRRESTFFGDLATTDVAFFGQTVVPTDGRPPQVPSRRGSVLGAPPRPSMLARATSGRDESEELRDLMEGLGRPRSNSVPFRIHTAQAMEDPNARPTSDGASVRRQSSPFARDAPAPERYERLPWSDDKYARRPPSSSTRSIQIGNPDRFERPDAPVDLQLASQRGGARQLDGAVAQVRSCLASLHTECPSQWERHRKLQSISKIMKSLQRDGSRSKFRSLSHEEFQYERVLEETPSIVQLLRLAGYVSQPHKLIMRNVNQEYIAVLLLEIEEELHEMQATQDYL